jgi:hypothetical protein
VHRPRRSPAGTVLNARGHPASRWDAWTLTLVAPGNSAQHALPTVRYAPRPSASKFAARWLPSQNGLSFDCPQRRQSHGQRAVDGAPGPRADLGSTFFRALRGPLDEQLCLVTHGLIITRELPSHEGALLL